MTETRPDGAVLLIFVSMPSGVEHKETVVRTLALVAADLRLDAFGR